MAGSPPLRLIAQPRSMPQIPVVGAPGKKSGSGGNPKQGGTTAQHKAAGRKGGKAAARNS